MASKRKSSFKDRFKNKISVVGKDGEIYESKKNQRSKPKKYPQQSRSHENEKNASSKTLQYSEINEKFSSHDKSSNLRDDKNNANNTLPSISEANNRNTSGDPNPKEEISCILQPVNKRFSKPKASDLKKMEQENPIDFDFTRFMKNKQDKNSNKNGPTVQQPTRPVQNYVSEPSSRRTGSYTSSRNPSINSEITSQITGTDSASTNNTNSNKSSAKAREPSSGMPSSVSTFSSSPSSVMESDSPGQYDYSGSGSIPSQEEPSDLSAEDRLYYSRKPRDVNYTPYTVKDYEHVKTQMEAKLGSLGPDINTEEWKRKKEKADRMRNFAQNVQQNNTKKIKIKPKPENPKIKSRELSSHEKAKLYAKGIKRPKARNHKLHESHRKSKSHMNPTRDNGSLSDEDVDYGADHEEPVMSKLEELEMKHKMHQQAVAPIFKEFS
eukprot:gb/GECH01013567.1/.p1 GENE.gb/GECH01013567.1/~~gb/GECH01013567.1/.p1  ORF type:complete len:438 (+),score=99.72 gb/GECH01013567.1/:1-1314(+)